MQFKQQGKLSKLNKDKAISDIYGMLITTPNEKTEEVAV
jgi:hypothetical protein